MLRVAGYRDHMKQSELNKLLAATMKSVSKERGWRCVGGQPFWRADNLFFTVLPAAVARERCLYYSLRFKWFSLDDLLWSILGMTANSHAPMSLRANGAFALTGYELLAESRQDCVWITSWLEEAAQSIAAAADAKARTVTDSIDSIQSYLEFIEREHALFMSKHPSARRDLFKEQVLVALERSDYESARAISTERISVRDVGGFISGGRSFFELALAYIDFHTRRH